MSQTSPSFFGDQQSNELTSAVLSEEFKLTVGDHVRVLADEEQVKDLQNNHGGYPSQMALVLGKVGKVSKMDSEGDVVVEFGGCGVKCVFNPACLALAQGDDVNEISENNTGAKPKGHPIQTEGHSQSSAGENVQFEFEVGSMCSVNMKTKPKSDMDSDARQVSIGDQIRVIVDEEKVKVLQEGHGGFHFSLRSVLGKVGKIININPDDDVVVQFGTQGRVCVFNPACIIPAPGEEVDTILESDVRPKVDGGCKTKSQQETSSTNNIQIGDQVTVAVGLKEFKDLQTAGSGWTSGMAECFGRTGVVKRLTSSRDAVVKFGQHKFLLALKVLKRVSDISIGEHVRVIADEVMVRALQEGHGGYHNIMRETLGKVGRVVNITPDDDAVVQFGAFQVFVFNPACLIRAPGVGVDNILSVEITTNKEITKMEALMTDLATQIASADGLTRAVLDNNIGEVQARLVKDPSQAHLTTGGLSLLHIAAFNGHFHIVQLLVEHGADLDSTAPPFNNTPLIASMHHEFVAEYLIHKGCNVSMANNMGITATHLATVFGNVRLLHMLKRAGADFNVKDWGGNTPLHCASDLGRNLEADILINCPLTDLRSRNLLGYTPLHLAVVKQNTEIVEMLVKKDHSLVEDSKEMGITIIHFAASQRDLSNIMKVLIEKGEANVNILTHLRQTPLHVAASSLHGDAIKMLVKHGGNVNAQDSSGNTPLHDLLSAELLMQPELQLFPVIMAAVVQSAEEERVQLACYLLQNGADPGVRNNDGRTPLDECQSLSIADALRRFLQANPELSIQKREHMQSNTSEQLLGPKQSAGPKQPSGPKQPAGPKQPSVPKQPAGPKQPSGPKQPAGPKQPVRSAQSIGPKQLVGSKQLAGPKQSIGQSKMCKKCSVRPADVVMAPCGHTACLSCCTKLTICPECWQGITHRTGKDGKLLPL